MSDDELISIEQCKKWLGERLSELEKRTDDLEAHRNTDESINRQYAEQINKEIASLRDDLSKAGVKWDFRLDEQGGFINELKESIKEIRTQNSWIIDTQQEWSKDQELQKEVLRDHLKGLSPQLLLAKLDVGSARQTVKKCKFCGRNLIFYKDRWICGHGCTKPAVKADKTEKKEDKNCPYVFDYYRPICQECRCFEKCYDRACKGIKDTGHLITEKKKYIKKDIKDFKSDEPIVFVNPKFDVPKHLKASGGKTEKKEEHICVYCGGKLKYSHKFISEDEDKVYQFKCTKCGKISQTEHFNSFLGVIKASGGEKTVESGKSGQDSKTEVSRALTASKPPEPIDIGHNEYLNQVLNDPRQFGCKEGEKWITIHETEVVVKREDLMADIKTLRECKAVECVICDGIIKKWGERLPEEERSK